MIKRFRKKKNIVMPPSFYVLSNFDAVIKKMKEAKVMSNGDIVTRLRELIPTPLEFADEGAPAHLIAEAADEIERLRTERNKWKALAEGVAEAITNEGKVPEYHHKVMARHRSEWKVLWKRIDAILEAVRNDKNY